MKRFVEQQIIRSIQGQSMINKEVGKMLGMGFFFARHLINNLCRGNRSYGEVGTLTGVTVASANSNHSNTCWAVDNFSYWDTVPTDEEDPENQLLKGEDIYNIRGMKVKDAWMKQIEATGTNCTLYEADSNHFIPPGTVDVFYYDGDHSTEATEKNLQRYVKALDPKIVIVDDLYGPTVQMGLIGADIRWEHEWHLQMGNGIFIGTRR